VIPPIVLEATGARLEVETLGAEARRWSVNGVELLWPGDPAVWPEISPILYPIVGWTRDGARVGGEHYPLQLHGFARQKPYEVVGRGADFVRLALRDDRATRALYPFAFRFVVEYRLEAGALAVALEVENPGEVPAPYAAGLHPGFRWPIEGSDREGAFVRFEKQESGVAPIMVPGGLVGKATKSLPFNGRELPLSDDLLAHDAVCFLDAASRSLEFVQANGATIGMDFPGFDHCALWTRPPAPYLCLEAWTGYSDPEGFDGDLFEKPSMRVLVPGEKARHEAKYWFTPAAP
jgi:galactose mutarotase-like enzyme